MAQNVKIAGALFSNVPSIQVPDQNDVYHPFVDTSDATATAGTILNGYTAYVNGTKVTGTHSDSVSTTDYFAQDSNGYMVLDTQLSHLDRTRPFYVYKVVVDGYETMIYNYNITQIMWEYDEFYAVYFNSGIANASNMSLTYGDTYRVTWDGVEYILTPDYDSNNELYLGSLLADERPDRNPQYYFEIQHLYGYNWFIWSLDDMPHSVNVEHLMV